jgi:hypothetical protein
MKGKNRSRIFIAIAALVLVLILLGTFKSDLPVIQYLGNTTGVLLGFVLGIWWQESEKNRADIEKTKQFWNEYKPFLLDLEAKVNRLKNQIANPNNIYDTLIELRLPLPEAVYFQKQTIEINLNKESRQEIDKVVTHIRMLDEYMDFGATKLKFWHSNFQTIEENLWAFVRELNIKYSGKTAL